MFSSKCPIVTISLLKLIYSFLERSKTKMQVIILVREAISTETLLFTETKIL